VLQPFQEEDFGDSPGERAQMTAMLLPEPLRSIEESHLEAEQYAAAALYCVTFTAFLMFVRSMHEINCCTRFLRALILDLYWNPTLAEFLQIQLKSS